MNKYEFWVAVGLGLFLAISLAGWLLSIMKEEVEEEELAEED